MTKSINVYDRIAWIYDPISRWVLGEKYSQSKYIFLDRLQRGSKVLILGGGTGENLPEIVQRVGEKGMVYFMEASSAMIHRSKRRFRPVLPTNIKFIHSADFSQLSNIKPDFILTQYFLDVLSDEQLEVYLLHGLIHAADSINSKFI